MIDLTWLAVAITVAVITFAAIEAAALITLLVWSRLAQEGAFETDLGDTPERTPTK